MITTSPWRCSPFDSQVIDGQIEWRWRAAPVDNRIISGRMATKKTPDFRNGKLAHQGWLLLCWITWNGNADFGSCLPVKETRLFLADVDYVSIGNANRARTITPSTVAVFLQINLWIVQAKSDGSEKPPLKIGVSNCLLYDGFFLLPSCGRLNYIWML